TPDGPDIVRFEDADFSLDRFDICGLLSRRSQWRPALGVELRHQTRSQFEPEEAWAFLLARPLLPVPPSKR
ncbi:hypothetical protein SB861_52770, partial [Paraburkholderia sp. SIMBA_049]